jgi:hypothetical protein
MQDLGKGYFFPWSRLTYEAGGETEGYHERINYFYLSKLLACEKLPSASL